MVLSALAEGLDPSAAERVFGYRQATITTWLTRAGKHAQILHERFFCHLQLPHLQLDELRTRLRCATQVLWLWVAIDPCTKILPVLQLGPRTQIMAHRLIHSLRERLAPSCLPLFTGDGLNLYFYALTAHFGHWLQVGRRGRQVRRWQAKAGLIYGQVKKSYRCHKQVRVSQVMRLGTADALKVTLQGLGFSGRLNTAYIERVNLTIRHGIAATFSANLGNSSAVLMPARPSGVVASVLSLGTSSPSAARSTYAAPRTRGHPSGATLPAAYASDGCWKNKATLDSARGAFVPLAADFRLRGT